MHTAEGMRYPAQNVATAREEDQSAVPAAGWAAPVAERKRSCEVFSCRNGLRSTLQQIHELRVLLQSLQARTPTVHAASKTSSADETPGKDSLPSGTGIVPATINTFGPACIPRRPSAR